ncbi:hypothetical protein Tco_0759875 [Tanacetum coccineum]
MEEYIQFETERALRNGKVYNWETAKYGMVNWCFDEVDIDILRVFEPKFPAIVYNDALKLKLDPSFNQIFSHDTPIRKEFDEFCERWWGKNGKNKEPKEENWSSYSPHEEWKRMQLEKESPNQRAKDCIGEYEMTINKKDLEYMTDYLFSKYGPSFMHDVNQDFEKDTNKLIESPTKVTAKLEKEFDEWARENGYIEVEENEVVGTFPDAM